MWKWRLLLWCQSRHCLFLWRRSTFINCFHGSWQWETVASVLTDVLETSSSYPCVAEFAGGTTVPKQNIPQNKPWRQSCSGCATQMECKGRKIILRMVEGICLFWICFFFGGETVKCCSGTEDIPLVQPMIACGTSPEEFMILGFTTKLLLWSLKNETGSFQKGQMGCDTNKSCI